MPEEIVKIIIPSMGRAGSVTTTDVVAHASICVPESEAEIYSKLSDSEIIAHPDSVKGLMAKRQWIYDHYPNVMMIDDDMVKVKRNYEGKTPETSEGYELTPEIVYELIQVLADTAKQMGAYFFGYGVIKNPTYYQPQAPFKLFGNIPGWTVGMLEGSKLKYPTEVDLWIEDDYISLLNQYHHRHMLIDQRYVFIEKQQDRGGIVGQRDQGKVDAGLEYLRTKFGRKTVDSMWGGRKKNGR